MMNEAYTSLGIVTRAAGPVDDATVRNLFAFTNLSYMLKKSGNPDVPKIFLDQYLSWIQSSKLNSLQIDLIKMVPQATHAVTQSLEAFMMEHRTKTFRVFRGEYFASREIPNRFKLAWSYLDDTLNPGDALIISAPFSATGDVHPRMYEMLEKATELNVPVFVDAAFWGICRDIHLDLTAPCIETIAFSLSKCFALNGVRIGMELSRNHPASIALVNERGYINRIGALIATTMMKEFNADYIPEKYRARQEMICSKLNLTPSKTVIFGMGSDEWQLFDRDNSGFNRVCISRLLTAGD